MKLSLAHISYLASHGFGRLATVDAEGRPHVVPVGFRLDPDAGTIDVGGPFLPHSKKFSDVSSTGRAAFVVDDWGEPMLPRGIEVRGRAEIVSTGGTAIHEDFAPEIIRITPDHVAAWGIDDADRPPEGPADG